MKGKIRLIVALTLTVGIVLLATACGTHEETARSDETICVYSGKKDEAQKFKFQLLPGDNPRTVDNNDEIVHIPASYRFYAAFKNRSVADAGAPDFYLGYAKGNVPVQVQGQFRFRFNLDNACEWYANHGRRNANGGNLGFNARSNGSASALSPWVKWLNENFGTIAGQVVKTATYGYTWPQLVYGHDSEADADLVEPVDISYGKNVGRVFTSRLEKSLGGKYFCGVDPGIWTEVDVDKACPPIFFDTGPISTQDPGLMQAREATEKLRAQLENAQQEAAIREARVGSQKKDERTKQDLLKEQIATAKLEAEASVEVQKCIIFAKLGLDCDGHKPSPVIVGGTTKSG